ncbi:MAG: M13 family metallopeptidase [Gemmatimonadota bacterium]
MKLARLPGLTAGLPGLALALIGSPLIAQEAPAELGLGVELSNFDDSVRPQDDFFRHVNGGWLEKTEIPADRSNYGSFTVLAEDAEANLRAIIQEAADEPDRMEGSDVQKIGDLYASFMNTEFIGQRGLSPLQDEMDRIAELSTKADVISYMGYAQTARTQAPFRFFVGQDAKNSTEYISYLSQSGLGLPDRDYYFDESDRFAEIRTEYVKYVEDLLTLGGQEAPQAAARAIMEIETRIASDHWTRVQNRDRNATYNKHDIGSASELAPGFDWTAFLNAAQVGQVEEFIIRQPSFFEALPAIVAETPLEDWKAYFSYKLLNSWAPNLPQEFVARNFDFFGRTLRGTEENRPRWKRGVAAVQGSLGEMLGGRYVERHFLPESKVRMETMVENLRAVFGTSIDGLEWMQDDTKEQAQAKLEKFVSKIGFPDQWKDYSGLEIRQDDLIGNLMRSRAVEYRRMTDKLGKPVDRGEWFMTPQTVNAYYSSTMNEIVFPAAILQPPFFNVEADDAVNYGAIGAVIGHEFSHGFDDQGRKSDGDGNLRDWWTEKDGEEFKSRAGRLVDQYNEFSPIEGMNVNGELTLGENIGDLAGLTMAYRAYKRSLGGEEAPVIDGFTGDQRFFLGWAQVWRRKYRSEELRRRLVTDPHSPSEYRTNGILANMPEFHEAFETREGDGMYQAPQERVKIW